MPELEERQAKIEGILEQIDKRVTSFDSTFRSEISQIHSEIAQVHSDISQNRNEITSSFRWTVGIIITMWITIIITISIKDIINKTLMESNKFNKFQISNPPMVSSLWATKSQTIYNYKITISKLISKSFCLFWVCLLFDNLK